MIGVLLTVPQPKLPHGTAGAVVRRRLLGHLGFSHHERRVAAIALRMFDLLAPRHRLTPDHRRLLRIGALVHDAAKRYGASQHHIRGAQFVLRDRVLPLHSADRRAVAYLVRYHRGDVADVDGILRPGDGRRKLRILLGLLRAADALDSRHLHATALVIRRKGRKLRIQCLVDSFISEARRRFRKPDKFRLLEKELGLRIQVRVRQTPPDVRI
jgi:exopolyphosphatase/pppGpp-phosphohydrolase